MSPQIATNTVVTRDDLLDFVRPRHHAIIITARSDGSPQASPVTCGVDEAGRIVVATYPSRAKTRNARRDPRVSVVVLSDDFGGPWVQIDGDAEVVDVNDWKPRADTEVVVTNAVLQWVPGHAALLSRWARELPDGAWLAMQVPGNFSSPSHVKIGRAHV